jgi:hypothetical protein
VVFDRLTKYPLMRFEHLPVALSELFQQTGRPFDVGEEKGDRAGWDLGHAGIMRENAHGRKTGLPMVVRTLKGKSVLPGTSRDGSDGTRTRDLRRDRPAF